LDSHKCYYYYLFVSGVKYRINNDDKRLYLPFLLFKLHDQAMGIYL